MAADHMIHRWPEKGGSKFKEVMEECKNKKSILPQTKEIVRSNILARRPELSIRKEVKVVKETEKVTNYHREKNRLAAAKCRQRKKLVELQLAKDLKSEEAKNALLLKTLKMLKNEKEILSNQLSEHEKTCSILATTGKVVVKNNNNNNTTPSAKEKTTQTPGNSAFDFQSSADADTSVELSFSPKKSHSPNGKRLSPDTATSDADSDGKGLLDASEFLFPPSSSFPNNHFESTPLTPSHPNHQAQPSTFLSTLPVSPLFTPPPPPSPPPSVSFPSLPLSMMPSSSFSPIRPDHSSRDLSSGSNSTYTLAEDPSFLHHPTPSHISTAPFSSFSHEETLFHPQSVLHSSAPFVSFSTAENQAPNPISHFSPFVSFSTPENHTPLPPVPYSSPFVSLLTAENHFPSLPVSHSSPFVPFSTAENHPPPTSVSHSSPFVPFSTAENNPPLTPVSLPSPFIPFSTAENHPPLTPVSLPSPFVSYSIAENHSPSTPVSHSSPFLSFSTAENHPPPTPVSHSTPFVSYSTAENHFPSPPVSPSSHFISFLTAENHSPPTPVLHSSPSFASYSPEATISPHTPTPDPDPTVSQSSSTTALHSPSEITLDLSSLSLVPSMSYPSSLSPSRSLSSPSFSSSYSWPKSYTSDLYSRIPNKETSNLENDTSTDLRSSNYDFSWLDSSVKMESHIPEPATENHNPSLLAMTKSSLSNNSLISGDLSQDSSELYYPNEISLEMYLEN